ncbi:MAG: ACT domain-containing protein [Gammaproteobacteria bacterium]|nr:ACT domain-containing protein [Gammaproteobacteria bacterium]
MQHWYMLTLVGHDQPGIVARVTAALFDAGANLGEASMMRLGGEFTIMLRARYDGGVEGLRAHLLPIADALGLHLHVDACEGEPQGHVEPDVRISVSGADRPGIVSEVTGVLAEAGFNILELESDMAGSEAAPIYLIHIEGEARQGSDALEAALAPLRNKGVDVSMQPIDLMVG